MYYVTPRDGLQIHGIEDLAKLSGFLCLSCYSSLKYRSLEISVSEGLYLLLVGSY